MSSNNERVLDILAFLSEHPQGSTLRDIASGTNTTRATAYRTIDGLVSTGWVNTDSGNPARFTPSLRVMQLGLLMLRSHRIRELILPNALALASELQCTCMVAFYERGDVVYTDAIEWFGERLTTTPSGIRAPAYTTGSGTILLAKQPQEEIERVLAQVANRFESGEGPNPEVIRAEIVATQQRGYGVSDRTFRPSASGIGVAVFDRRHQVAAALGIHSDAPVDDEFLKRVLPRALDHAKQASLDLGHRTAGHGAMV